MVAVEELVPGGDPIDEADGGVLRSVDEDPGDGGGAAAGIEAVRGRGDRPHPGEGPRLVAAHEEGEHRAGAEARDIDALGIDAVAVGQASKETVHQAPIEAGATDVPGSGGGVGVDEDGPSIRGGLELELIRGRSPRRRRRRGRRRPRGAGRCRRAGGTTSSPPAGAHPIWARSRTPASWSVRAHPGTGETSPLAKTPLSRGWKQAGGPESSGPVGRGASQAARIRSRGSAWRNRASAVKFTSPPGREYRRSLAARKANRSAPRSTILRAPPRSAAWPSPGRWPPTVVYRSGTDPGLGLAQRELPRPGEEPLRPAGQGQQVQLAAVEEDVGQEIRRGCTGSTRGCPSPLGDQLEEVRPPATALAVPLHLDPSTSTPGRSQSISTPRCWNRGSSCTSWTWEPGTSPRRNSPHQRHRPVGGVLHGLHAVGAGQGGVRRFDPLPTGQAPLSRLCASPRGSRWKPAARAAPPSSPRIGVESSSAPTAGSRWTCRPAPPGASWGASAARRLRRRTVHRRASSWRHSRLGPRRQAAHPLGAPERDRTGEGLLRHLEAERLLAPDLLPHRASRTCRGPRRCTTDGSSTRSPSS